LKDQFKEDETGGASGMHCRKKKIYVYFWKIPHGRPRYRYDYNMNTDQRKINRTGGYDHSG
jgi:hypothetical protein